MLQDNQMPQCMCGRFFKRTNYSEIASKEEVLCPPCKVSSTPTTYVNSVEWVCGDLTNLTLDKGIDHGKT